MPSFEEDAFARAQQMHRRRPQNQSQTSSTPPKPQESPPTEKTEKNEVPAPQVQTTHTAPSQNDSFLNVLFKDKDRSIILLLIILLMEENSNPTLLLALIYLLI